MTRIAVTGAGGFLGRATLRAARSADPQAVAVVRTGGGKDSLVRTADLRRPDDVLGILEGVEVLIHLAAAKRGGFHDQYPSTVKATEYLLDEAERAGVRRVVLVSSFAVYDYAAIPSRSTVDEESPVDRTGVGRDAYTQTKVLQEDLARSWSDRTGVELIVARPGVVYGPGSWWTYRLGERFGRLWLCLGNNAEVPMSFVDNCADALVHLARARDLEWGTYNVFDGNPPRQRQLRRALKKLVFPPPLTVPVPWPLAALVASTAEAVNQRRSAPLRLPGFLVPESLAVRAKPLRYSNARLRETGWSAPVSLETGLVRTFA